MNLLDVRISAVLYTAVIVRPYYKYLFKIYDKKY